MKRGSILKLLMFALIALQIVACSKAGKDSYTKIIPKGVVHLISIDVDAIYKKAGIDNPDNDVYKNMITTGLEESESALVKQILSDPSTTGVDFKSPVYFYAMDADFRVPGFVAKMGDKAKFMELLAAGAKSGAVKEVVQEASYAYAESDDGEDMVVFNDELIAIILMSEGDNKKVIEATLGLPAESSIVVSESFDKMLALDGDIKAITSTVSLPKDIRSTLKMGAQASNFDIDKLNIILSMSFDDGEVNFYGRYFSNDDATQMQLDENLSIAKKMNGDLLGQVPANALMAISAYIDGPKSWDLIQKQSNFAESVGGSAEIETFVKPLLNALEGDIMISPVSFSSISDYEVVLYAEVNSSASAALEAICSSKELAKSGITKKGDNQYAFESMFVNIYFGIKDNLLYLTNKKDAEIGKSVSPSLKSAYSGASDKSVFIVLNVTDVLNLVKAMGMTRQIPSDLRKPLEEIKSVQYSLSGDGVLNNIKIELNSGDVNSLKFILDYAKAMSK